MSDGLLVNARDAAVILGLGERTLHRHHAQGLIPAPVRLGGRNWWRRDELADWVAKGCPPRSRWAWKNGR